MRLITLYPEGMEEPIKRRRWQTVKFDYPKYSSLYKNHVVYHA